MSDPSLTALLSHLFTTGGIATLVLTVMLLEGVLLLWLARRSGGSAVFSIVANLASGACLVLALRAALIQLPWTEPALWLGLSFAAHLADLVARLRREMPAAPRAALPASLPGSRVGNS